MVEVKTIQEIRKSFTLWNGWGPPTSQYQIGEYCKSKTHCEEESNYAFNILMKWVNED